MAEYRLTPAAERDLEAIWTYTVQQWGADQANRYTDIMTEAFAELARSPKTAPACDHTSSQCTGTGYATPKRSASPASRWSKVHNFAPGVISVEVNRTMSISPHPIP